MTTPLRTYVYIDGFNLYYRGLKKTPFKWLDLKAVCQKCLQPHNHIVSIKYFTALVSGVGDPQRPIRQKTYIRALKVYIPEVSVYYGKFTTHKVNAKLVEPINGRNHARIYKTEEKGSDVNLAVHMLNDAWMDSFDCAIILSNDSDLAESMRMVKEERQKLIGLLIPPDCHPSVELQKIAHFQKIIRQKTLSQCQMPQHIPGTQIYKPAAW